MENQPQHNQTSLEVAKLPNSTISLINTLPLVNGFALTEKESTAIAMQIIKLDFETVLYTEKIFQAVKTPKGKQNTFKIICGLLTFFSKATKVKQPLTNSEIIMCTDWIMKTFTHDSVEDIALALKEAIFGGHKFYGAVTIADVRAIIEAYMTAKYEQIEKVHKNIINDPSTLTHSPIITHLLQRNTNDVDNCISFVAVFDKERRAKIANRHAEVLARLPKIMEENEYFKAVESGVFPAYEVEINDNFEKSNRETTKIMSKIKADDEKKYGWFKQ